jgi:hypothetical protein
MRLHTWWLRLGVCLLAVFLGAAPGVAQEATRFDPVPGDPDLTLGTYQHRDGGKVLDLTVGIGSALFRGVLDFPGTFWTVSDRGPNIACDETELILDLDRNVACPARPGAPAGTGRIYPRPDCSPSIYHVALHARDGTFRILNVIPLRGRTGTPITGLPNPLTTATTEVGRDGNGEPLPSDVNAVDAEAIVRVPLLGRFFIGEENGTSLVEVAHDGRVLTRFVPAGTERDYTHPHAGLAPADYAVEGSLPAILAKRRLNRGIESLAISREFRHLYFLLQSPLDNPDTSSSARDSRNLRLFKARLRLGPHGSELTMVAEYVYPMATVAQFQALGVTDAGRQRDLRVSEMVHVDDESFLVIERTDQATIVFEIDLRRATNILGTVWDDAATRPTLEQQIDLAAVGIVPAKKKEVLVASSLEGATPRFPPKLEGLALTRDGRLLLVNDDDFGIAGGSTQINLVEDF